MKISLNSKKYPDLVALIDDEDFELVSQYTWSPSIRPHTNYAQAYIRKNNKASLILMHQVILSNNFIDHINGNGLDNRRLNLRLASPTQNGANRKKQSKPSSSKFKGVSLNKSAKKWEARIKHQYQNIYLGIFEDEIEAALAYDQKARELFGEYARLNFPNGVEEWTILTNSQLLVPLPMELATPAEAHTRS